MLKSHLIEEITKKQDYLSVRDVTMGVNSIIDTIMDALGRGKRVEIRGFGSFSLHYRAARRAHNPKTGEKLTTSPKYAVHFKPGKEMRERINASRHLPIQDLEEE
ncbi:MAG: integration host factor subunit beta [Legionellaceae bacterium]|nr:integration host factor subunit beta [Legionellaceae bacterium]|tara:strand:+ start:512 stop:826 length:315 start_codon:yes stop_codon:yes gene_type:complete